MNRLNDGQEVLSMVWRTRHFMSRKLERATSGSVLLNDLEWGNNQYGKIGEAYGTM